MQMDKLGLVYKAMPVNVRMAYVSLGPGQWLCGLADLRIRDSLDNQNSRDSPYLTGTQICILGYAWRMDIVQVGDGLGDSLEWNSAPVVQPELSTEVGYSVSVLVRVDSLN